MAISGLVYSPKEWRVAIAEETTFGTAVTSSFLELYVTSISKVDYSGIVKDDTSRHSGKRVRDVDDVHIQTAGGLYAYDFECVLTKITADLLMYGVLQNVSEAVGTPFKKDYVVDENTTQPDFSANSGKFYSFLLHNPITSESELLTSAILENLTVFYTAGSNGGRLMASGRFVSGFAPNVGLDSSGYSFTSPGTAFYNTDDIVKKQINSVDMILEAFSFNYTNGFQRVPTGGGDSSGDAETYALIGYDMEGSSITVKYDANSKTFIDDFIAGTTRKIQIDYGTTDNDSAFIQTINNAEIEGFDKDFSGGMALVTIPFKLAQSGSTNAIDIEISNAVDRSW